MIPDETTSPSACQSAPHSPALRVILVKTLNLSPFYGVTPIRPHDDAL